MLENKEIRVKKVKDEIEKELNLARESERKRVLKEQEEKLK